jgi:hypothetical protein
MRPDGSDVRMLTDDQFEDGTPRVATHVTQTMSVDGFRRFLLGGYT